MLYAAHNALLTGAPQGRPAHPLGVQPCSTADVSLYIAQQHTWYPRPCFHGIKEGWLWVCNVSTCSCCCKLSFTLLGTPVQLVVEFNSSLLCAWAD